MLTRRFFLLGAGTLSLAALNSGCNSTQSALRVSLLRGSIPPQLIDQFRRKIAQHREIALKPEAEIQDVFNLLQKWVKQDTKPADSPSWQLPWFNSPKSPVDDLVTLGDFWLETAIQEKLIQPLSLRQLPNWENLPPSWQEIVQRDATGKPSLTGQIWGAPYRWGTTMIAYRKDKFKSLGWQPTDWSDLWRPELRGRISIVDHPREVIGLTLKKLGYSYNSANLAAIPQLSSELKSLQRQIKFYSSNRYLQPLILGDTWLAVGWSSDILSTLSNNPDLQAVIPRSGTSLWSDVWVRPTSAQGTDPSLAQEWIDFCWQAQSAYLISRFTEGASPVILTQPSEELPKEIGKNSLLLLDRGILEKSEFILPLAEENRSKYLDLWKEIRLSPSNNS